MLTDHLGSIDVVTDATGKVVDRRSYDPFGQRRSLPGTNLSPSSNKSPRLVGFTGHEDDVELGLVNMKGRMYDPRIGRFLTPDPMVSQPLRSQRWNPYSYVSNRPLSAIDPSGFEDMNMPLVDVIWGYIGGGTGSNGGGGGVEGGMPYSTFDGNADPLGSAVIAGAEQWQSITNGLAWSPAAEANYQESLKQGSRVSPTSPVVGMITDQMVQTTPAASGNLLLGFATAIGSPAVAATDVKPRYPNYTVGRTPGGALAVTDKFGEISVRPGLSGKVLQETLGHEGVHSFFSPMPGGAIQTARADFGMWAYMNSDLLRYVEEAIAETNGTGSLAQGVAFPFSGYGISPVRMGIEATVYVGVCVGPSVAAYSLSGN